MLMVATKKNETEVVQDGRKLEHTPKVRTATLLRMPTTTKQLQQLQ